VHPAAAGATVFAADGRDLTMTELLRETGTALGRPARLFPVPARVLAAAANLAGRHDLANRLFGTLQVDVAATRRLLGWTPPVSVEEALRATARHFLLERGT